MYWLPKEMKNGPMKLMPQTSKIPTSRMGFKGIISLLKILPVNWQFLLSLQKLKEFLKRVCQ